MSKMIYIQTLYQPTVLGPRDEGIIINGYYGVKADLIGEQNCPPVHRGVALYEHQGVHTVALVSGAGRQCKGILHPVHHQGDHTRTFATRDEALAYANSLLLA